MTTLIVDCRERAILELAQGVIDHETRQLDLGDFNFMVDEELVCCMERKTYADLLSSIGDGRFREQRDRMRCTIGPARMAYILEGFPEHYASWDAGCLTAMLHMQHRDGISIVRTHDAHDTVKYIALLMARIAKEPEKYKRTHDPTGGVGGAAAAADAAAADASAAVYQSNLHASQVSRKKGSNLGSAAVYRLMLSTIPGISERIAANIEAKMGSFIHLMTSLMACATYTERMNLLTTIDKVGSGKASQILECFGFTKDD